MEFFNNKTYLVTGASSGIGRAVARTLASAGAHVVLLGRREAALRETMAGLDPGAFLVLPCDLADLSRIGEAIQAAMAWRATLAGMVYCAGVGGLAKLRDHTPEFVNALLQVNCVAFIECVRQLARLKKKTDPLRVLALTSRASLGHHPHLTAYAASKAALEAAARTMAVELAKRNVRINLIRPAYVNTPMIVSPLGDFHEELTEKYQPLGLIEPEEVARMAFFLLGPAADRINGSVFDINAGATD